MAQARIVWAMEQGVTPAVLLTDEVESLLKDCLLTLISGQVVQLLLKLHRLVM